MLAKHKWLLLPPALGLVLFLGPLQAGATGRAPAASKEGANDAAKDTPTARTALPELPSLWQVGASLAGVLLLGGAALFALKHARQKRPLGAGEFCVLRQSLRLSPKHVLHAVEFENEILLVGACDGQITVLRAGAAQAEAARDDRAVRERDLADDDDLDAGAVPRDFVIPRPPVPAARARNAQVAQKLASFRNAMSRSEAR